MYVCVPEACLVPPEVRSGAFHPLELELQIRDPPYGFGDLNSNLSAEQQVLLTTRSSLQPQDTVSSSIQLFVGVVF